MTRTDELNAEIRNQAVRLYPKCAALFELPLMVYTQTVADNLTRSKPLPSNLQITPLYSARLGRMVY